MKRGGKVGKEYPFESLGELIVADAGCARYSARVSFCVLDKVIAVRRPQTGVVPRVNSRLLGYKPRRWEFFYCQEAINKIKIQRRLP